MPCRGEISLWVTDCLFRTDAKSAPYQPVPNVVVKFPKPLIANATYSWGRSVSKSFVRDDISPILPSINSVSHSERMVVSCSSIREGTYQAECLLVGEGRSLARDAADQGARCSRKKTTHGQNPATTEFLKVSQSMVGDTKIDQTRQRKMAYSN